MRIKKTLSIFLGLALLLFSANPIVANAAATEQIIFHHTDALSGTSIDTDANGNIVEAVDYYPFGEIRIDQKLTTYENKHKFTGKEFDKTDNLYYYGARYYDPSIGRFISADPMDGDLANPQSLNKYSYVMNNPMKYTDITGNMAEVIGAVGLGIGGILSVPVSPIIAGTALVVAGIGLGIGIYEGVKAISTPQVNTNTQAQTRTKNEDDYITLYRGDGPEKTYFYANGLDLGKINPIFKSIFKGNNISQAEIDAHQLSSRYSPYVSATKSPAVARIFANGEEGDKEGSIYTIRVPTSQVVYMGGKYNEYGIRYMVIPSQIIYEERVLPINGQSKIAPGVKIDGKQY